MFFFFFSGSGSILSPIGQLILVGVEVKDAPDVEAAEAAEAVEAVEVAEAAEVAVGLPR